VTCWQASSSHEYRVLPARWVGGVCLRTVAVVAILAGGIGIDMSFMATYTYHGCKQEQHHRGQLQCVTSSEQCYSSSHQLTSTSHSSRYRQKFEK
jgi:hypothetical protein